MNKLPICLSITALLLSSATYAGTAQPTPHCVDASVYQPINQVLLGNSIAKYIPRHFMKNHHVWIGAFGQASMSYSTAYGLLPGAVDTNNSVLLMNPAKNFTMSFNQLDTYFGFQHGFRL